MQLPTKRTDPSCGSYWDWVLDWTDLNASPVFSASTGFGGNGEASSAQAPSKFPSVGDGHCVRDGPFANLSLPFFNSDDHNHCLSRGFRNLYNGTLGQLSGWDMRPASMEKILNLPDFDAFYLALERGPHNAIPNGIGGDFVKFTAPNDPLFFLHHTYVFSSDVPFHLQLGHSLSLLERSCADIRSTRVGNWIEHGGGGSRLTHPKANRHSRQVWR